MATDSIRELIIKNIETVCRGITVANGYQMEMATVSRAAEDKDEYIAPATVVDEGPEMKEHQTFALQHCRLPVTLWVLIGSWKDVSSWRNRALADVGKAMMVDYTRGTYATNTQELGNEEFYLTVDEMLGVKINYSIWYRHRWNDPYAQT